jgi:parvulin-like peptidyl-prolyl isomerase
LLVSTALGFCARALADSVNGIVAIVNSAIITEKEVQTAIEPAIDFLRARHQNDEQRFHQEVASAYLDGLEKLIERRLVLDDYNNITNKWAVPESILEEYVKDRARERFGDRVTMTRSLAAQGKTYETWRRELREQYLVEIMMFKNVSSTIVISPYRVESHYNEHLADFKLPDQVKLRSIDLSKASGGDPGAARRLATELIQKLDAGAAFAELASIYSEGPHKPVGGDRGWVTKDSGLLKEILDAAFALKAGQHSAVIETPESCYVLSVEEVRANYTRPLSEVSGEIEQQLMNEERARLRKKYIEKLKKTAFIRRF